MTPVQQAAPFPDTRWSLILRLQKPETSESVSHALNELCKLYWQPLYAYLRRVGQDPEAAKDSVQGFLAYFLSQNGFGRFGPANGKFRHFLLGSLRNFIVSEARKSTALKRGGLAEIVPLDIAQAEQVYQTQAAEQLSPEASFDRQWAQTVWNRALAALQQEQRQRGKEQLFDALKPALTGDAPKNNPALQEKTGLEPARVAVMVHRLRRRLRELVIEELSETVGAHADLQDELNYFLSVWSK